MEPRNKFREGRNKGRQELDRGFDIVSSSTLSQLHMANTVKEELLVNDTF
jgi:hypothetical protein